jgi:hypothetical protein
MGVIDPSRFEIECGKISVEGGTAISAEELCPVMTIDADAIGFLEAVIGLERLCFEY